MPYYVCYNIAAMIDAWFVSKGKTIYLFVNSVIVNIVYYGIMYALFKAGAFHLNIYFIIHLFGLGMVVHMLISVLLYFTETRNRASVLPAVSDFIDSTDTLKLNEKLASLKDNGIITEEEFNQKKAVLPENYK